MPDAKSKQKTENCILSFSIFLVLGSWVFVERTGSQIRGIELCTLQSTYQQNTNTKIENSQRFLYSIIPQINDIMV